MNISRVIVRAAVCAAVTTACARAATTIVVDRRPASDEGKTVDQRLLLRELARQATLIAAERAGLATIDRTLVSRLSVPADAITIDVEQTWDAKNKPFAMAVRRGDATLARASIPCDQGPGRTIPYDKLAAALAREIDGPLADALRPLATARPATRPAADEAAALRDVEPMLGRVNAFDAFRAAHRLHALVAPGGDASPATLSALARAYANLGESTRPFVGPQFDAAFARALLYADLLVARRPGDAASYWTRSYVRAFVSLTSAGEDVEKAKSLGGERPAWGALIESYLGGDAGGLFEAAATPASTAPLAAHLAMRAVEFCGLSSVTIHFADVALAKDPASFRAMLVANDNAGVGNLHVTTARNPVLLNRAFDAMVGWPELPAALRPALFAARRTEYDAATRLALWAALDGTPGADEPLPWAFLADVARESSLILAQRRLDFVANHWSVDAQDDFAEWWPVVRTHPAAPAIEAYVKQRRPDKAKLTAIPTADLHATFWPFVEQLEAVGAAEDATGRRWARPLELHFDRVVFEMQRNMWRYRFSRDDKTLRPMAQRLYEAAPDDLTAIVWMICWDYDAVKPREAELRERAAAFPPLLWQLGAWAAYYEPEKGAPMLEALAKVTPDFSVFLAIAEAQARQGKIDDYVRTLERFLQEGDDTGLQFADARDRIAKLLMGTGQDERALPYARAAADSYAGWALKTYAENLARLGRYGEARAEIANERERYGEDTAYRQYFRGLMYPPLAEARIVDEIRTAAAGWPTSEDEDDRRHLPVLLLADGKLDEAAAALARSPDAKGGNYGTAAFLAIVQLMRGDEPAIRAAIDTLLYAKKESDPDNAAVAAHQRAARFAVDVLDGKGPPPMPETTPILFRPEAAQATQAADACLIGLACDRAGHADTAKAWLRRAVWCTDIGPGRVAAAIRLRAMGVEPFGAAQRPTTRPATTGRVTQ